MTREGCTCSEHEHASDTQTADYCTACDCRCGQETPGRTLTLQINEKMGMKGQL